MKNMMKQLIPTAVVLFILFSGGILSATEAVDPGDYSTGQLITASGINDRFTALYSVVNGLIDNYNLASDPLSLSKVSNGVMVNSGGNIGIGTASPGTLLDVSGVITATGGTSTTWNTAYSERLRWDGGSTGLAASTGRTSLGIRGYNSAYTSDNAVYIAVDGNVGIGTTSPDAGFKLHVISATEKIAIFEGSAANSSIIIKLRCLAKN